MAIELNSAALNIYRNAAFADADTIINNDGAGIREGGLYKGAFSALSRSAADKVANNEARTALLKALGQAFHVDGMTETDGKTTFSKDFMKTLEKILGSDFKRGDFGINSKGEVTSGKPLTMRRIKAIVDKADFVGKGSFNLSVYEKKLDAIMKDLKIDKLSDKDLQKLAETKQEYKAFIRIKKAIEFLKYEADRTVSLHPQYEFEASYGNEDYHGPKYQYFNHMG